jgi:hypothetical protein
MLRWLETKSDVLAACRLLEQLRDLDVYIASRSASIIG